MYCVDDLGLQRAALKRVARLTRSPSANVGSPDAPAVCTKLRLAGVQRVIGFGDDDLDECVCYVVELIGFCQSVHERNAVCGLSVDPVGEQHDFACSGGANLGDQSRVLVPQVIGTPRSPWAV